MEKKLLNEMIYQHDVQMSKGISICMPDAGNTGYKILMGKTKKTTVSLSIYREELYILKKELKVGSLCLKIKPNNITADTVIVRGIQDTKANLQRMKFICNELQEYLHNAEKLKNHHIIITHGEPSISMLKKIDVKLILVNESSKDTTGSNVVAFSETSLKFEPEDVELATHQLKVCVARHCNYNSRG